MGLTALDSGVVIGFLDRTDPFHSSARAALGAALAAGEVLLPAVAYAETSVAVLRAGSDSKWFDDMLTRLGVQIGSCGREAASVAASLRHQALTDRRRRQWKMPDALVVGEAIWRNAVTIVTTDSAWPKLAEGPSVHVLAG